MGRKALSQLLRRKENLNNVQEPKIKGRIPILLAACTIIYRTTYFDK